MVSHRVLVPFSRRTHANPPAARPTHGMQTPSSTATPPTRTLPPCLVLAHYAHMRGQPTCRVSGPRRALHDGSFRTSRCGQPSVIGHQDMGRGCLVGPRDAGNARRIILVPVSLLYNTSIPAFWVSNMTPVMSYNAS